MAEIPASWGLTPVGRPDGRLDLMGTDDTGKSYKARTTETGEVTESDLRALHEADREATTARKWVDDVMAMKQAEEGRRETAFEDELMEAAGPVVKAGLGTICLGYTHIPQWRWDLAFKP